MMNTVKLMSGFNGVAHSVSVIEVCANSSLMSIFGNDFRLDANRLLFFSGGMDGGRREELGSEQVARSPVNRLGFSGSI